MSFHNRISAIQMRMQEIQSKFGSSSMKPKSPFSAKGLSGTQATGMTQATTPISGLTFDQILASKMNEPLKGSGMTPTNVKNNSLSMKASDYDSIINEASKKFGVDSKFVKCIIQQESGFQPNATSRVGAMGMMQLMPSTAKSLGVKNGYDPRENIMGGVKYIKQQLDRFGGNKEKALAAYNAGPGTVQKYGGIPPYPETQNYVKNIMGMYRNMGGS
ncbi:MAG: lytic transglycosylase domain-containing protein [Candidatus Eremiobacteraeota bacterium]|nr:lytic transglycosylase domain-containing protein [Candidatus Eremiobacteraeota bacterium]